MKMKVSPKSASDLLKLGIYQVAGGIIGILITLWAMLTNPFPGGIVIAIFTLVVFVFGYSITCGVLCIRLHQQALRHSLINQVFQLVTLAIGGFAFQYTAGIFLHIGFDWTYAFRMGASLGISGFSINYNSDSDQMSIYINIVALLLIIWIERLKKRTKEEEVLQGLL